MVYILNEIVLDVKMCLTMLPIYWGIVVLGNFSHMPMITHLLFVKRPIYIFNQSLDKLLNERIKYFFLVCRYF